MARVLEVWLDILGSSFDGLGLGIRARSLMIGFTSHFLIGGGGGAEFYFIP